MYNYEPWIARTKEFFADLPAANPSLKVSIGAGASPEEPHELLRLCKEMSIQYPKAALDFIRCAPPGYEARYGWLSLGTEPEESAWIGEIFEHERSLYGGVKFSDAAALLEYYDWLLDHSDPTEKDLAYMKGSAPFYHIGNGDVLSVMLDAGDDPPVVYISMTDRSYIISPSFTQFLTDREKLCYLGPEIWMLSPWLERDEEAQTAYINADSPKTEILRRGLMRLDG